MSGASTADTEPDRDDAGRRRSDKTRADILLAAARRFRNAGYQAATMQQIGALAGTEAGSIYYHFPSKARLLAEVLDLGVRSLHDEVGEIIAARADAPVAATFAQLVATHLNFLLTKSDFTSANIRNYPMLPPALRASHRPLRHAYAGLWAEFLRRGVDAGELRDDIPIGAMRHVILSAMNWTVEWYDAGRQPVALLASPMTNLLLNGICLGGAAAPGLPVVAPALAPDPDAGKAAQTRFEILRGAARSLRDHGYRATTLRRIAAEAQLEAGSVYYHFASKEQLVDEVLHTGLKSLTDALRAAIARSGPADHRLRIATAIATHLAGLFSASEFTSANIRSYGMLPEALRQRHRPLRHDYARLWDLLLAEAQQAGVLRPEFEIVTLRRTLLGALNWTVEWFDPSRAAEAGHYGLAEFTTLMTGLLLDGIRSPRAKPRA